jgi:transcriptional regulator with XRE-family HTH domain
VGERDDPGTIGRRVQRLRVERGLTQRQLAEPVYTPAYVSTLESGRVRPSDDALRHLAGRLGVAFDELATGRSARRVTELRLRLTEAQRVFAVGEAEAAAEQYAELLVEAETYGPPGEQAAVVKSARGTVENPGKNVAQKSGLNRSISQEAWGRTVTMLTYKAARHGGTLHKVPAPGTSQRCSMCGFTTPGSRESQAVFGCKNEDCGWSGNADHNAARNILHLYRMGRALIPAAGRAVVRRARRVKPATAR